MGKVKCVICEKEIKTTEEITRSGKVDHCEKGEGIQAGGTSFTSSKEGVYFMEGNKWFCNHHWEKILKNIELEGG